MPKRDDVAVSILDIIFHDKSVFDFCDLFLALAFTPNFKRFAVNDKICCF